MKNVVADHRMLLLMRMEPSSVPSGSKITIILNKRKI